MNKRMIEAGLSYTEIHHFGTPSDIVSIDLLIIYLKDYSICIVIVTLKISRGRQNFVLLI